VPAVRVAAMSDWRGFMSIIYRSRGWQAEIYNQDSETVWLACLRIMLETFRFNNPRAPMLLLDPHDLLDEETRKRVASLATLVRAADLETVPFGGGTYNKLLALRWSPFQESALIDLDFVISGDMEDIFNLVPDPLGVLHYPGYRRTQNRVNSGVIVVKDRSVLDRLDEQRSLMDDESLDEDVIDQAIENGRLSATLIPDTYGKSKQMWWARSPEELTIACASHWSGPLKIDWVVERPIFRLGDEIVRAWHFSSAKNRMAEDDLVRSYLDFICKKKSQKQSACGGHT